VDWAEQTHKAGRKVTYGKLPKTKTGSPIAIDGAYEAAARPVICEQIGRAGVRLAKVLNSDLQ
jgi:hypothetical protein